MNPTYPSSEQLAVNESALNSLPKPIQVAQPVPTPSPSSLNVQPVQSDQPSCLNPIIMTNPCSSSTMSYIQNANGALSIPQVNNNVVNSVPPGKPGLISSSPYIYQGIPFGQQIFLANPQQNGFVIAQPQGASYMIAPPQPQFQVRGPSAGQQIPMTFFLGPQQASGLIQLPQQQPPANVLPAMNPQPLVCANPPVAVQQQSPLQQIPQGVAVTRLPNGGCPILPNNNIAAAPPPNPIPVPSPTVAMVTTPTPPIAISTGCNGSPGPTLQPVKPTPPQPATRADPGSVLRQLNQEISNLQNMSTPLSEQQKTRLQKLVDARDKVQRSIELSRSKAVAAAGGAGNPSAVFRPGIAPPQNASLRPRPPGPPTNILPAVRTEVVNLLMKHRLLPVNQTGGESVLVEFRLNSQRYQLYLTRTQKADLESLIYTLPTNQKKADVLLVYQTEQMRFFATHPRPAPPVAAQLRLVRPPVNQIAHTAPQPGIAQPTQVQPPPQSRLPLPMCVLAPAPPLTPNSAGNSTDSGSKCQPVKASVFGPSIPIVRPAPPQSVAPASQKTPNPLSQPSAQQLRRHNAVRGLFHSDQMASNARPPVSSPTDDADDGSTKPLPTLEELINLLAPYHVHQDMDNSPEALEKVDDILDKAFGQLNTRKRQTVDAINSILYVEKWQLMERPSVDRIPLTRLLRDSETERFEAERTAFNKIKTLMAEAAQPPSAKRIRQLLEDAAPDFITLEFDENGNSRPAILQLEEKEEEAEEKKPPKPREQIDLETPRGIPPDSAWPTWEIDNMIIDVDDDGDIDFRPPSPDVDIANIVVEEDEVQDISLDNFGEHGTISPLNSLPMEFLPPSTSRTEMPRNHLRQSTEEDGSCQRLKHSEDPTVDEAIRSIIDL
nr:phosphopantothenate cysteine ligase [Hymenolepis microstoma]